MDRWLSRNEYSRIRYKAKTLGALSAQFHCIDHTVNFEYTYVSFAFYPFQHYINIRDKSGNNQGHFSTKEEAEGIRRDMDKALKFVEFLEKFNEELPERAYAE